MNENKNVETVWMYVFRKGQMTIHACTVGDYFGRKILMDGKFKRHYPKDDEFNVVISGTTIFLRNRDDGLVRKMFLEHKKERMEKLQKDLSSVMDDIEKLQD